MSETMKTKQVRETKHTPGPAPELLDALRELLLMIDCGISTETLLMVEGRNPKSVLGDARAAIANAEGK